MSHVDYLCPSCNARVGMAHSGSGLDPLDWVRCENCHQRMRFHYLIRDVKINLLKTGGLYPAQPPSFVANRGSEQPGATTLLTIPSVTILQGSTLVVSVVHDSAGDPDSATWNALSLTKRLSGGGGGIGYPHLSIWTRDYCPAATASVLVDLSSANPTDVIGNADEFSGTSLDATDRTAVAIGAGGGGASSGFTQPTRQNNELLYGIAAVRALSVPTSPVDFVQILPILGTISAISGYRRVTSIGQYRYRATGIGATLWVSGIITLKS